MVFKVSLETKVRKEKLEQQVIQETKVKKEK